MTGFFGVLGESLSDLPLFQGGRLFLQGKQWVTTVQVEDAVGAVEKSPSLHVLA